MHNVLSPRAALLGGVLALLLTAAGPARAAEPDARPDPFQEANRRMEKLRKLLDRPGLFPKGFAELPDGFGRLAEPRPSSSPRLGAAVRTPSEAMADQLDLPSGQGLVIDEVVADSAAAKAGLKRHDVLLELNGKAVPSSREEFVKLLASVEANKPVGAVVLRKGKKETLEGLTLPEVKAAEAAPAFPRLGGLLPGGAGGVTAVTRINDRFTVTHKDGKVALTVKGTVEDGKPNVQSVTVADSGDEKTYDGLDAVPAEHREQVKKLAGMAAGGEAKP